MRINTECLSPEKQQAGLISSFLRFFAVKSAYSSSRPSRFCSEFSSGKICANRRNLWINFPFPRQALEH
jgi:hypothetical protein